MDHFGLKVPNMAQALAKWRAAGFEVQREFKGSEGFPNAFLIGPDGLRFELQEDTTLKVPTAYHVHFRVPEPAKLWDWYVDEVKNLKEFYDKLIARGIKFDVAYRQVPEIGLNISYLTDPAGTYIEVTEGYTGY